jgi:hypothetical protein
MVDRRAYNAAYRTAHREERLAYDAAYRAAHREERKVYDAARWVTRREEIKAYKAAYYSLHREEIQTYKAAYHAAHREERRAYAVAYDALHREERRARDAARRALDIKFKLTCYLRTRLNAALRNHQKTGSAVHDLGCTIPEFIDYIAAKFQPGMSWDNYGEWHLDHIKPLAAFDLTDRTQFVEAARFTNYQPLWALDNIRKGAREAV